MLTVAAVAFAVIVLLLLVILLIIVKGLQEDTLQIQSDVNRIVRAFVPPSVGGRPVPSSADIAAARARADTFGQNQVSALGVAQVGGPPREGA
jgi:hypothetical protein